MNRTLRAILGVIFILIITFSAISIFQSIGRHLKVDITEQGLYTLSDGTKGILARLNQPLTLKLYYAKTAAMKGTDQIKFFDNYFQYVKSLLEEYVANSGGKVTLEIIDPRPFSDDEVEALRYGIKRFPITEEEAFFFGLVVQTQFGVEKSIEFFSPDRQNFVEYDISALIDSAITREKSRVGILTALPMMGDDMSDYMVRMMQMQGQQPKPAWGIVEHLKQKYEVVAVPADTDKIEDVDLLMVVHPKDLSEKTLFAIDQYVLNGGRTIIYVDPFCLAENPRPQQQMMMQQQPPPQNSNLPELLGAWGLEMPDDTFAGDLNLALKASMAQGQRPEKILGYLQLTREQECFNNDNAMAGTLNKVRMLYPGILRKTSLEENPEIRYTPLLMTTPAGNSWKVRYPNELMMTPPSMFLERFIPGTEPVIMGYQITGKLPSAFPEGIVVEVDDSDEENSDSGADESGEAESKTPVPKQVTGLTRAVEDCVVVVYADVDFISDIVAYQRTFFGNMVVDDNAALALNTLDELGGSSELISIRSRGNFERPFTVVNEIEKQAEQETADEEKKLNAEIEGFERELNEILSQAKEGEEEVIGSSILAKKKELELKIREAQRQLREVKMKRRERIEDLGNRLRNANMLAAPAVILVIAIVLGIYRGMRKRHYISQADREG